MTMNELDKLLIHVSETVNVEFHVYWFKSPALDGVNLNIRHLGKNLHRDIYLGAAHIRAATEVEIMQDIILAVESLRSITELERVVLYDRD